MTFWTILVVLCLLAVAFAVWPLWRGSHRLTPLVASIIVFTVALSAGLYDRVGSPDVQSGRGGGGGEEIPGMNEALSALQARLADNPEDIAGWKMLGRTQMAMRDFAAGVETYEKVMGLENGQNAQTLVDLALAIMSRDRAPLGGRSASLITNALALDPQNQAALFYSGAAAAERGDTDLAATYWETLLGLNPPEEIRGMLEQRVAEWRGAPVSAMSSPAPAMSAPATSPAPAPAEVPADAVVTASISLSGDALAAIRSNASVFIIARDPAAPSPPIAVVRRSVSDLPAVVSLTDANSMVEGRNLSAFAEVELLARVSLSGGPAAATGDWFGSIIVQPSEDNSVTLTIDQQVP